MKALFSLVISLVTGTSFVTGQPPFPVEKLDSFITQLMSDWHVMGVAVSIVRNDTILLEKGYGYSDFRNKLPVTSNTIFPIASCSKTFVCALMGVGEQDGRIALKKPVHEYLPEFRMMNEQSTMQATVEDLLCHRTGLPGHDWAWTFNTNFSRDVYFDRISHMETSAALREKFQYSNFMFFVLSAVGEKAYNQNWNDVIREKFFTPLEMQNSYAGFLKLDTDKNLSLTYDYADSFKLDEAKQMDDLLGAASISSTVEDMSHWMQMWINKGVYKGKQILPSEFVTEATASHIIVDPGLDEYYPDEQFMNMGLSWFLSSYRGHYRAHHTGNIAGYSSSITFFPYDSLGIVVLTNRNSSPLIHLIPDFVSDLSFNLPVRDKNSVLLEAKKAWDLKQKKNILLDTVHTPQLFVPANYAGTYYNPGYGPFRIEPYTKGLLLTYYDLQLVLLPKGKEHLFFKSLFGSYRSFCRGGGRRNV